MKRYLPTMVLCLILAGCASLPRGPGCVRMGPAGAMCLLAPAALPAVQAHQMVKIARADTTDTFIGSLHVDGAFVRLAGASLFGVHLFTIDWDGHDVAMHPPQAHMHPALIVAMLQLAIASPANLRPRLHGLTLEVTHAADGSEVRDVLERGRLIAHIVRSPGPLARARLSIAVPPARLRLDIKPLEPR